MALDLTRLTNAVNKYLNSISSVNSAAQKAAQEIESRTAFATELKDAIAQNIQSRTRDEVAMPNIAEEIQTRISQATGSIDNEIQQINGSFEAIREAGNASAGRNATEGNADAYMGELSTEALQELSKSQYFSANLLQTSLFDVLDENGAKSSGNSSSTSSAFDTLSLSDLNTNALLKNAGLDTTSAADTLLKAAGVDTTSDSDASALAKSLIKAYTNNKSASAVTSIFGDFSL